MGELKNKRREMFCQYYVTELNGKIYNATQSAIKAGFSKKTAYSQGQRLLKYVEIQQRIKEIKEEVLNTLEMDKLYVMSKYKKILEDDISNYMNWKTVEVEYVDPVSGETRIGHVIDTELTDSTTIDTWNIAEAGKTKAGFKIKLHCKDKALTKVVEYMDLFNKDTSKDVAPVIIVDDLPSEEGED